MASTAASSLAKPVSLSRTAITACPSGAATLAATEIQRKVKGHPGSSDPEQDAHDEPSHAGPVPMPIALSRLSSRPTST